MKSRSFGFLLNHKNKTIRNLFFFYNIFIRNYKFLSHSSQFKEDIFLKKYFRRKNKGKFVDLGCFHPTRHNNTYQLYKKKWSGINIDLNPLCIEMFDFLRPRDINLNTCLSKKKSYKKLFYSGELSPLNTIDPYHTIFIKKNFNLKQKMFRIKKIKTENIDGILKKYKFFVIDFLSIDLEGHEYDVLNNFRFDIYKVNLICVEMLNHDLKSKKNSSKITNLLKKNNFRLIYSTGVNKFFKNNERISSS
jgi:hypothetical protein